MLTSTYGRAHGIANEERGAVATGVRLDNWSLPGMPRLAGRSPPWAIAAALHR
jgi:hypothetical protein